MPLHSKTGQPLNLDGQIAVGVNSLYASNHNQLIIGFQYAERMKDKYVSQHERSRKPTRDLVHRLALWLYINQDLKIESRELHGFSKQTIANVFKWFNSVGDAQLYQGFTTRKDTKHLALQYCGVIYND